MEYIEKIKHLFQFSFSGIFLRYYTVKIKELVKLLSHEKMESYFCVKKVITLYYKRKSTSF